MLHFSQVIIEAFFVIDGGLVFDFLSPVCDHSLMFADCAEISEGAGDKDLDMLRL